MEKLELKFSEWKFIFYLEILWNNLLRCLLVDVIFWISFFYIDNEVFLYI